MPHPTAVFDLNQLSGEVHDAFIDWLADCDFNWQLGNLETLLDSLPSELQAFRNLACAELVKIDLDQCWRRNLESTIESYLEKFPQLGTVATVDPSLLFSEWESRHKWAKKEQCSFPLLDEFLKRFPQQADTLRKLICQTDTLEIAQGQCDTSKIAITGEYQVISTTSTDRDLTGSFGRYKILQKLGQGGMGEVYLAEDMKLHRRVAMKVPYFDRRTKAEVLERFDREAVAIAKLDHPNICRVYDVSEFEGQRFMLMEYIDGKSLCDVIQSQRLSDDEAIRLTQQVAEAVGEAHKRNIIHRDLKPANIMLTSDGQPKVTDFGLARHMGSEAPKLTHSGMALGTPAYMPLEQINGDLDKVGPHSDIYSLGVILFELLTGHVPYEFPRDTPIGLFCARVLSEPPSSPTEYRPDLDPRLTAIIIKAISKSYDDRYPSMAAFSAALQEVLDSPATQASHVAQPITRERGGRVPLATRTAIAMVFFAVLFSAVILWLRNGDAIVKIEVLAEDVEVSFVNESIKVIDGKTEYRVRPGDARLHIKVGDAEFDSDNFTLKRGANPIVRIEPTKNLLVVQFGDEPIGSAPLQAKSKVDLAENERSSQTGSDLIQVVRASGDGKWRVENGVLTCVEPSGDSEDWLLFGNPAWTDYDFKVWATAASPLTGHGPGVLFRSISTEKGYCAALNVFKSPQDYIDLWDGPELRSSWNDQSIPRHVSKTVRDWSGKGHEINVSVRGATVRISVDGERILFYDKLKHLTGCVGVRMHQDFPSQFRNPKVTAPDGTVLMDGWPELPPEIAATEAKLDQDVPDGSHIEDSLPIAEMGRQFTEPNDKDWHGTWRMDGEELVQNKVGKSFMQFGNLNWTDYDMQVEMLTMPGLPDVQGGGIDFRSKSLDDRYSFYLGSFGGKAMDLTKMVNRKWSRVGHYHQVPLILDHWYAMRVEIRGSQIRCIVDGVEIFSCTDVSHANGKIGLGTWNSRVKWRNLTVTDPDGKLLWEGFPDLNP